MKNLLALLLLICAFSCTSQDVFWTEDFGSGCNTGQLASSAGWSIANTGMNETNANTWYISAAENGQGAGNCGAGCGSNQTLHLGNILISFIIVIPADNGASYYDSGAAGFCGLLDCSQTDRRAESPVIDCSDREDIVLDFSYIEGGSTTIDNATLWYNDGSSWTQIDDPSKTACCGGPCNGFNQGLWTAYSISLPASANNNPDVQIGFRWVNNDDAIGTDPSFAVDDITLSGGLIDTEVPCIGDFNNSGNIDTIDLLLFLGNFGCIADCPYDMIPDGIVAVDDLLAFLTVYGTICP